MPYDRQIPDAPIALSMLPRVETPTQQDLLLVTQPGQPLGQRSRGMELSTLFASQVYRDAAAAAAGPVYTNTIHAQLATLPRTSGDWEFLCKAVVPFHSNALYRIWGNSNPATTSSVTNYATYEYGLRVQARSLYVPDDQDRNEEIYFPAGIRAAYGGDAPVDPNKIRYNAQGTFYNAYDEPSSGELAAYPTKTLSLRLKQGMDTSLYRADDPTQFDLYVQFIIFPFAKYDGTLLKASE